MRRSYRGRQIIRLAFAFVLCAVAHVAEWTGLEIKSLDRYRSRWSPVITAKGRGQLRTLFHRDKLIAILREQFPDITFPA